jgi:hypothetical protein
LVCILSFFRPIFYILKKIKVGLWDHHAVCVSVYHPTHQPQNTSTNHSETWYVYHGTWAHLNGVLHKSIPSVCVSVCVSLLSLLGKGFVKCIPPLVFRQQLGKHVPAAMNTRSNRGIVGRIIFFAVRSSSKESLWVGVWIILRLLGTNSVKPFPRQRIIHRFPYSPCGK